MKRVYVAAAVIVASGAGVGFLLRPVAPEQAQAAPAAQQQQARQDIRQSFGRHGGGGGGLITLPGGDERVDCFYLRVAYNSANKPGNTGAQKARAQGVSAGCWMPE